MRRNDVHPILITAIGFQVISLILFYYSFVFFIKKDKFLLVIMKEIHGMNSLSRNLLK